eukprot:scaffold34525_cov46-Prasinocladus_malaysianus.AAC.1
MIEVFIPARRARQTDVKWRMSPAGDASGWSEQTRPKQTPSTNSMKNQDAMMPDEATPGIRSEAQLSFNAAEPRSLSRTNETNHPLLLWEVLAQSRFAQAAKRLR